MANEERPLVGVRPRYGLPRFRRNACVEVRDQAIVATNRWEKARRLPLSGAADSPKKSDSHFDGDKNL
jgi:hypothetical protein